jgi:hypothetical protein
MIIIPDNASEQLKQYYENKKRIFSKNRESLNTVKDRNVAIENDLQLQKKKVGEQQAIIDNQTNQLNQSRLPAQMLCLLTDRKLIIHLDAGRFSFGGLNCNSNYDRHYCLLDNQMADIHFALHVEYNISPKEPYRCQIKNIGNQNTLVNQQIVGNGWSAIRPHDVITAGGTTLTLLVSKK